MQNHRAMKIGQSHLGLLKGQRSGHMQTYCENRTIQVSILSVMGLSINRLLENFNTEKNIVERVLDFKL